MVERRSLVRVLVAAHDCRRPEVFLYLAAVRDGPSPNGVVCPVWLTGIAITTNNVTMPAMTTTRTIYTPNSDGYGSPVNSLTRLLLLGSDPLGGTAAALRHLPPFALPMSALSADEPAGAHATREPTEQPWSSPFPPSLAFHGRAIAGHSAALPADPRTCDARRRQRAGTLQVPSVRP